MGLLKIHSKGGVGQLRETVSGLLQFSRKSEKKGGLGDGFWKMTVSPLIL